MNKASKPHLDLRMAAAISEEELIYDQESTAIEGDTIGLDLYQSNKNGVHSSLQPVIQAKGRSKVQHYEPHSRGITNFGDDGAVDYDIDLELHENVLNSPPGSKILGGGVSHNEWNSNCRRGVGDGGSDEDSAHLNESYIIAIQQAKIYELSTN